MRRFSAVSALLLSGILLAGCYEYKIPLSLNNTDMNQEIEGERPVRAKTAILLPVVTEKDETRLLAPNGAYTLIIPFKRFINEASEPILSQAFTRATVINDRSAMKKYDIVLEPLHDDMKWQFYPIMFQSKLTLEERIKINVYNKGERVMERTYTANGENFFSTDFEPKFAQLASKAIVDSLRKAAEDLKNSEIVRNIAGRKTIMAVIGSSGGKSGEDQPAEAELPKTEFYGLGAGKKPAEFVTVKKARLRVAPTTSAKALGTIAEGTKIQAFIGSKDWIQATVDGVTSGWVYAKLLKEAE